MRTPRPAVQNRRGGVSTLIGYGWLKEAPKNLWPRAWDIKSRSQLKKCLFMPIPPDARAFLESLPPQQPIIATPAVGNGIAPANRPPTPHLRRKDANRDVRAFAAMSVATQEEVVAAQKRRLYAEAQARLIQRPQVMVGGHANAQPISYAPMHVAGLARRPGTKTPSRSARC